MDEYIKREDALRQVLMVEKRENMYKCVKNIPAADVRPVVLGKWNTVKYPLYECSNCGAIYQEVGYGFNFCPNCGAKMED